MKPGCHKPPNLPSRRKTQMPIAIAINTGGVIPVIFQCDSAADLLAKLREMVFAPARRMLMPLGLGWPACPDPLVGMRPLARRRPRWLACNTRPT